MRSVIGLTAIILLLIYPVSPVEAGFTISDSSGRTSEEAAYAQKALADISWDCSRVNQYNEIVLQLPGLASGYTWSVSRDTGKYVGIKVEWKSFYYGPGGQSLVLELLDFQRVGLYIDLINVNKGMVVASETYIYEAGAGIEYLPPEKRIVGAIDDQGNITGLYDVWGKQIVQDSVYTHEGNRYINFPDVKTSNWAHSMIYKMAAAGYISGYPDNLFKPDSNITRAEFTVVLNKLLNDKSSDGAASTSEIVFPDLKPSFWSYRPTNHLFSYMSQNDVTNIFEDKFYPDKYITREEVSAVLYSILKNHPNFKDHNTQSSVFSDTKSSKYLDGISFCYSESFMVGYPNKLFKPKSNITRAEIAALMCKVHDSIQ